MQTRRDQAQAYRFAQLRARTALVNGEPDVRESLLRRSGTWTFVGAMVAVILVAGYGIFGLIRPGGRTGWDTPGVLIVEKETGARFVYDQADGLLHPVLNYTSARLILNTPNVRVRTFSRASLEAASRGTPRGQAGLPDSLPTADGLVRSPWLVCSRSDSGSSDPEVTVSTGLAPSGQLVSGSQAVLVRADENRIWLIWNGRRLQITEPESALAALGYDAVEPLVVQSTWLNSLPPGPDLVAPSLAGIGSEVRYQAGDRRLYVGQVLKVTGEGAVGTRYYLTLEDGLRPMTETEALLILADPEARLAYGGENPEAFEVAAIDVAGLSRSERASPGGALPDQVPSLVSAPGVPGFGSSGPALCAAYGDTSGASVDVAVYLRPGSREPESGPNVQLPPGSAALVRLLPHAGLEGGALFLVTDSGAKYPVPSPEVLTALGLDKATPVPLPAGIADLIPTGPALDPAVANAEVTATTAAPAVEPPDTSG